MWLFCAALNQDMCGVESVAFVDHALLLTIDGHGLPLTDGLPARADNSKCHNHLSAWLWTCLFSAHFL